MGTFLISRKWGQGSMSRPLGVAFLALALAACQSAPRDRSEYFARMLVGQWEYESGPPDCRGFTSEAYRADGTFTHTSSDCDIVSDGFGRYRYGWYVAREHLCLVHIEAQQSDQVKRPAFYRARFLEMVAEGFVADRCHGKIQKVTPRTITLQEPTGEVVVMQRSRWL
jgi:hypothetical protein